MRFGRTDISMKHVIGGLVVIVFIAWLAHGPEPKLPGGAPVSPSQGAASKAVPEAGAVPVSPSGSSAWDPMPSPDKVSASAHSSTVSPIPASAAAGSDAARGNDAGKVPTVVSDSDRMSAGGSVGGGVLDAAAVTAINAIPTQEVIVAAIQKQNERRQARERVLADRLVQIDAVHKKVLEEQKRKGGEEKPFEEPLLTPPDDIKQKLLSHQLTGH